MLGSDAPVSRGRLTLVKSVTTVVLHQLVLPPCRAEELRQAPPVAHRAGNGESPLGISPKSSAFTQPIRPGPLTRAAGRKAAGIDAGCRATWSVLPYGTAANWPGGAALRAAAGAPPWEVQLPRCVGLGQARRPDGRGGQQWADRSLAGSRKLVIAAGP